MKRPLEAIVAVLIAGAITFCSAMLLTFLAIPKVEYFFPSLHFQILFHGLVPLFVFFIVFFTVYFELWRVLKRYKLTDLLELHLCESEENTYIITMGTMGLIRCSWAHKWNQAYVLQAYIKQFSTAVMLASKRFDNKNIRFFTTTWILYELSNRYPKHFSFLEKLLRESNFKIENCNAGNDPRRSKLGRFIMSASMILAFGKKADLKELQKVQFQRIRWDNDNVVQLIEKIESNKSKRSIFH